MGGIFSLKITNSCTAQRAAPFKTKESEGKIKIELMINAVKELRKSE